ncbi:MAG: threonylcarbamoyl-AMP synthase [Bacteroidaceae bacterium]|nr:threonylcarbamoyl-AMP synthase [Bacteroidaceae bacterium]
MSKERDEDIRKAIEVLRQGGTILYPTDTIWGIGCDATNPAAVKKVFELKQREDSKALICLVDSAGRLQRYVRNVPDVAWDIIDLATKPTTVILSGAVNLAPNLLAEDGSVGLRVTSEVFSHTLCYRFQKAIVSTSANISGEPSPQTFADISDEIKKRVDYICESRQRDTSRHDPSAIIKLGPTGEVTIIRR